MSEDPPAGWKPACHPKLLLPFKTIRFFQQFFSVPEQMSSLTLKFKVAFYVSHAAVSRGRGWGGGGIQDFHPVAYRCPNYLLTQKFNNKTQRIQSLFQTLKRFPLPHYHSTLRQFFSTFVRPRPGKLFLYKTRARSQQIYSKIRFQFCFKFVR